MPASTIVTSLGELQISIWIYDETPSTLRQIRLFEQVPNRINFQVQIMAPWIINLQRNLTALHTKWNDRATNVRMINERITKWLQQRYREIKRPPFKSAIEALKQISWNIYRDSSNLDCAFLLFFFFFSEIVLWVPLIGRRANWSFNI